MEEGVVLAGKYRLEALLGHGGMGSVWRAHHLGLDAPVAVKLMAPGIMTSPGMLQRFHREAQAAAQLRSPHVVQIFDHGVDAATSSPFIVMELLEGESLLERLGRVRTLSPVKTARLVTDVCRALGRAHEAGIIHRDLKPANLFLVSNDDQEITKVLDFGIAKSPLPLQGIDSTTNSGSILGTPLYMSPEQISGGKFVDARSDLWSLAVVVCECLTGRRPFSADSIGALTLIICTEPPPIPSRLGPVPEGFDAWFERAVSRDPNARFQTAREFAEQFRKLCGLSLADEAEFVSRRSAEAAPLPLAPTVDLKDTRTADALSKTSHEYARPNARRLPAPRLLAAGALVAAIAASVAMLDRASNRDPDLPSPGSASPTVTTLATVPHASNPSPPLVTPAGDLPSVPASAAVSAPTAAPSARRPLPTQPGRPLPPPSSHLAPSLSASSPTAVTPPAPAAPPTPATSRALTIESVIDERR